MLVTSITNLEDLGKVGDLADLVEFRLDHLREIPKPHLPSIFTFRKKEQGGVRDISERDRLAEIERLLEQAPEYCDIEADTDPVFIERISKRFPKVKLIGSYHNFQQTPRDLEALLQKMYNPHFDIYKTAATAQSTAEMLQLMIFARNCKVPLSVMSMGEYGKPSRIIAPIVGSVLNYAGVSEDAALYRYSLKTLHEVFHYRKLNRDTVIYGLIGDSVEQSPGDLFHNARFEQNAVYVKMKVLGEEVPEFFQLIRNLPFGGLSVTIPLKEAVFNQMDEINPAVKVIGAINTVIIRNQRCIGTNTDGIGALNVVEKRVKVRRKRVAILGAGGTARSIAYEAMRRGAFVSIFNRTLERAQQLGLEFGCEGYEIKALSNHPYDVLINTIPSKFAIVPEILPKTVVMDVTYFPKETPLLLAARKLECDCIYGEEMFVEQAILQQLEWQ